MKQKAIARFKEASTWRGLVAVLTAIGVTFEPEQVAAIVAFGMAVAGLIGVIAPDTNDS